MKRRSGFTLVELVVVIMILGILAGVAAPKLLNTSGTAVDNGLRQSLAVIRNAIELYAAQNAGNLPAGPTSADVKTQLSAYLRGTFPPSPVGAKDADITIVTSGAPTIDGDTGWSYSTATGEFICNSSATSKDGVTAYSAF